MQLEKTVMSRRVVFVGGGGSRGTPPLTGSDLPSYWWGKDNNNRNIIQGRYL